MSEGASYPLFCPVAMAADMIEPRWTLLILSEMWSGSTRFSQIHRGVPGMSPALLSKRLRDMHAKGLVHRESASRGAHAAYVTTPSAYGRKPLVELQGLDVPEMGAEGYPKDWEPAAEAGETALLKDRIGLPAGLPAGAAD